MWSAHAQALLSAAGTRGGCSFSGCPGSRVLRVVTPSSPMLAPQLPSPNLPPGYSPCAGGGRAVPMPAMQGKLGQPRLILVGPGQQGANTYPRWHMALSVSPPSRGAQLAPVMTGGGMPAPCSLAICHAILHRARVPFIVGRRRGDKSRGSHIWRTQCHQDTLLPLASAQSLLCSYWSSLYLPFVVMAPLPHPQGIPQCPWLAELPKGPRPLPVGPPACPMTQPRSAPHARSGSTC